LATSAFSCAAETRWPKQLLNRLTHSQRRELHVFIASNDPEIPDEGRYIADILARELAGTLTFDEHVQILMPSVA
jgi:hypothetical protein